MKLNFTKNAGGLLMPASDLESVKMERFKTGEVYEVDIKLTRNPSFHGKVFKFLTFCFEHWSSDKTHWENMSTPAQFDSFRKELTILAGYKVVNYSIDGLTFTVEAQSLSYASMTQEEFEQCYTALTNEAMKTVFKSSCRGTYDKLIGFF